MFLIVILSTNHTQRNISEYRVQLSDCYAECHYVQCHNAGCRYGEFNNSVCRYAKCHYAECRYAECRYAECRYAECHPNCQIRLSAAQAALRDRTDLLPFVDSRTCSYLYTTCTACTGSTLSCQWCGNRCQESFLTWDQRYKTFSVRNLRMLECLSLASLSSLV
jgi:hypothetical protein